jgi:hypothetical protein
MNRNNLPNSNVKASQYPIKISPNNEQSSLRIPAFQTPNVAEFPLDSNLRLSLNEKNDERQHHTLGQIADQFQERARAIARTKGMPLTEASDDEIMNNGDESDDEPMTNAHGESTGRWTKQEHELFLEALKKYGKV